MSQPHVMGIINSTPDSFYKKSRSTNSSFAIKKSNQMISDGASIIDIGGESSRPGAKKISIEEEMQRVLNGMDEVEKSIASINLARRSWLESVGGADEIDAQTYLKRLDSFI